MGHECGSSFKDSLQISHLHSTNLNEQSPWNHERFSGGFRGMEVKLILSNLLNVKSENWMWSITSYLGIVAGKRVTTKDNYLGIVAGKRVTTKDKKKSLDFLNDISFITVYFELEKIK